MTVTPNSTPREIRVRIQTLSGGVSDYSGPPATGLDMDLPGTIQLMEYGVGVWQVRPFSRLLIPWHRVVSVTEIF